MRYLLILTLLTGTTSAISTISEVSVKAGASVTIPCLYGSQYKNHVKYLCEGDYWHTCSYAIKTNSSPGSGKYSIFDDKSQTVFNVILKHLTMSNTNYWCAVEINNAVDVRQYFHVSVSRGTPSLWVANQEVTGFIGETITINCNHTTSGAEKWCKLNGGCVTGGPGSINGLTITINSKQDVFSVTMRGLKSENSGWYYCVKGDFQMPVHLNVILKPTAAPSTTVTDTTVTEARGKTTEAKEQMIQHNRPFPALLSLIIPLSLLTLIIFFALLILLILRTKHVKKQPSIASTPGEEGVTYAHVTFKKNKAAQPQFAAESDADVTYSSIVSVKQRGLTATEAKDEEVTYSKIIRHKQTA